MRGLKAAILGLVIAALAACSGGEERSNLNLEVISAIKGSIAERRKSKDHGKPSVTRAVLDKAGGAFLLAVIERNDQFAYMSVSAAYVESQGHVLIVWRSADNVTLVTRNNVLIATRGLPTDLISTDVGIAPDNPGPTGGKRQMIFRGGNDQAVPLNLACELTDLGPRTITIVEQTHRTRLWQEHCTGDDGEILNEYWIDRATGVAWQSRQWAGPRTGYIRLKRLTLG